MTRMLLTLLASLAVSSATAGTVRNVGPLGVLTPRDASLAPASTPLQATGSVGGFVRGGKLLVGRYGHSATLLQDGRVLIAEGGGFNILLHDAEIYDPATGSFTETGPGFYDRTYIREGSALLPDGRVLIVGGCGSPVTASGAAIAHFYCNGSNGAEIYNPSTGTFSRAPSMADKRVWATTTVLQDGRVLIAAGSTADPNDLRYVMVAEIFDSTTDTFSPSGSLGIGRISPTATLLNDGKVLIAGGQSEDSDPSLTEAELYDPTTGQFEQTGSMISERMAHTATLLLDGRVLMVGGVGATLGAELYDPTTGTFSPAPSDPIVPFRYYHSAVRLPDGRVLILGGVDNAVYEPIAEIYDPATGLFQAAGNLIQAVQFETATLLQDGRVLKSGGEYIDSNFELPKVAEVWIPNPAALVAPGR